MGDISYLKFTCWKFLQSRCYIIDYIVHVSFHFISVSLHFIDHTSFLFPSVYFLQSISFLPFFYILFGCIHITWSFNLTVSFTFQQIPFLEINDLRVSLDRFLIFDIHYLKLNSGGFTTPCLFILNNKYNMVSEETF